MSTSGETGKQRVLHSLHLRSDVCMVSIWSGRHFAQITVNLVDSASSHMLVSTVISEQLMSTNKRAQADERKITRNEGFSAPPTLHLLCMCSLLLTSEFFPFAKTVRGKVAIFRFPWNLQQFTEREKVAETFWQCTFSLDKMMMLGFWSVCLLRTPPRRRKWPSHCAHLLVHINRPPRLSRACLSISVSQQGCKWLIKKAMIFAVFHHTWVTVENLGLTHATYLTFGERLLS